MNFEFRGMFLYIIVFLGAIYLYQNLIVSISRYGVYIKNFSKVLLPPCSLDYGMIKATRIYKKNPQVEQRMANSLNSKLNLVRTV